MLFTTGRLFSRLCWLALCGPTVEKTELTYPLIAADANSKLGERAKIFLFLDI